MSVSSAPLPIVWTESRSLFISKVAALYETKSRLASTDVDATAALAPVGCVDRPPLNTPPPTPQQELVTDHPGIEAPLSSGSTVQKHLWYARDYFSHLHALRSLSTPALPRFLNALYFGCVS